MNILRDWRDEKRTSGSLLDAKLGAYLDIKN